MCSSAWMHMYLMKLEVQCEQIPFSLLPLWTVAYRVICLMVWGRMGYVFNVYKYIR